MASKFSILAGLVSTTGLVGLALTSMPEPANAFSSQLTRRYTSNCVERVKKSGKTSAKALEICQCSLKNLEKTKKSEFQAIAFLVRAQGGKPDPSTGLPIGLTPYVSPCL